MAEPRRMTATFVAAALCAVCLVAGSASAANGVSRLQVFTVASGAAFINTADDRARGAKNNPFDAATNSLRPKGVETGDGPFAGDVAVFSFDLYANKALRKRAGTASYT